MHPPASHPLQTPGAGRGVGRAAGRGILGLLLAGALLVPAEAFQLPLPAESVLPGALASEGTRTDPDGEAWSAIPAGWSAEAGLASDGWLAPDDRLAADVLVAGFRTELARLMGTGSRSEQWGLLVVSADHGDTLYAWNAHEPMVPASNMKLFTSAAALHLLGPDFRFPTWLLADGPVVDGVLHGNLVLYGTGDPTLRSLSPERPTGAMAHFLEVVQEAGIREVRGQVVGDGSYFTGDPRRPSWNPRDLDNWYAAPVSGLTFNENMVTLRVAPEGPPGSPPVIRTIPESADIPLVNEGVISTSGGPALAMVRDDPDDPIRVVGTMRPRQVEAWRSMTVADPPRYAASILAATLRAAGIQVTGEAGSILGREGDQRSPVGGTRIAAPGIRAAGAGELWSLGVHHSAPVSELIHPVNKRSHNLYAELLLLAMGRVTGETPDFEGGSRALHRFLVDEVGVEPASVEVVDGSGLSRLNRTSPAGLIQLLAHMDRSPHHEAFTASLPVAGTRQELARMDRSPAAGNLAAKTGTINRTSALSGVVRGADGERLLFSILVNDVPSTWAAKRAEDRIGIHLAGFRRALPAPDPAAARVAGELSPGEGSGALQGEDGSASVDGAMAPRDSGLR